MYIFFCLQFYIRSALQYTIIFHYTIFRFSVSQVSVEGMPKLLDEGVQLLDGGVHEVPGQSPQALHQEVLGGGDPP